MWSSIPNPAFLPGKFLTPDLSLTALLTIKMATPEEAEAVTAVFWDINKCPVPRDFDACLVGLCIKRFLESYGYYGPLTITAVGVLTDIPNDILREVYSSGIALATVPHSTKDIPDLIFDFTLSKPPPANIMIITDPETGLFSFIPPRGYNLLLQDSLESFLVADSGALEEDKCSENGESPCSVCSVCCRGQAFQGFEDFTTHLASRPHQRKMLDWVSQNVRLSRRGNAPYHTNAGL